MNEPDVELTIGNEESHYVYVRTRYLCRCRALKDVNGKSPLQFGKDARPADIPLAFWGGVGIAVLTPRTRYFGYCQMYICLLPIA